MKKVISKSNTASSKELLNAKKKLASTVLAEQNSAKRVKELGNTKTELEKDIESLEKTKVSCEKEADKARVAFEKEQDAVTAKKTEKDALDAEIKASGRVLSEKQLEIDDKEAESRKMDEKIARRQTSYDKWGVKIDDAKEELAGVEAKRDLTIKNQEELESNVVDLQKREENTQVNIEGLEKEEADMEKSIEKRRKTLKDINKDISLQEEKQRECVARAEKAESEAVEKEKELELLDNQVEERRAEFKKFDEKQKKIMGILTDKVRILRAGAERTELEDIVNQLTNTD